MNSYFYKVEYDLTYSAYWNGDYHKIGSFVLIPVPLVERLGMHKAFEAYTGHSAAHIIHWSHDELYDSYWNIVNDI